MSAAAPDLLALLDASASQSFTTPGAVRQMWLDTARLVAARDDGTFDSGRIRAVVPEWAHGPEAGAAITGMVRRGEAEWTGRMAVLGNDSQRAGSRLVKVYRLTPTPQVALEATA